jgi:hypothetical protein
MIAVVIERPVADDGMIDVIELRDIPNNLQDAIEIAVLVPGISGVDQNRVAIRGDQQRRGAPFDVNEIQVESTVGRSGNGG